MIERPRAWRGFAGLEGGFGGVLGCTKEGVSGYAVNRWGIKRPPNGTKFDGGSVGAIPRPLGKSRPIPRTFFSHSRNKVGEGRRTRARVSDLETDNGEKD